MTENSIDKRLFYPAIIAVLAIVLPMVTSSSALVGIIKELYNFMTTSFGWSYLLLFFFGMIMLGWIAFGPYGQIKIGKADEKPHFTDISWATMVVSAGFGIGIVNWSMVEPTAILSNPPFDIEPKSAEALEVAAVYGLFHWGPFYWVLYLLPSLPIIYFIGVRGTQRKRVSECFAPLIGKESARGFWGMVIDTFVIFGLVGGIGATLGFAIPLVSGLLNEISGIADTFKLKMCVLSAFTLLIATSVFHSLNKGLKLLSNINCILALILLTVVLIGGPTSFLFNLATNTVGLFVQYLPKMSTWTDPVTKGGFPANWTMFYGAWILAYAPMMGLFITSISYGRTLRGIILGCLFWGTVSAFLFFIIIGGFSLHIQYYGLVDIYIVYANESLPKVVATVLSYMPMTKALKVVFLILTGVLLATTIDAATRVLANMTSKELYEDGESPPVLKLIWCGMLVALVFGILLVGGMDVIQALVIGTTIPLLIITVILLYITRVEMKKDFYPMIGKSTLSYKAKNKLGSK